jgi:pantetheine-phosphate adenylyltransferase
MKAIYAGTFDPLTFGHLDIIYRASAFCDELYVAIAESRNKNTLFSPTERKQLIDKFLSAEKKIHVVLFDGLLVDFARSHAINYLIRGIRHEDDFIFESQLAAMNRKLAPNIETLWLPAKPEHTCISATIVREIARMRGDLSAFVPPFIGQAINEKIAV